MKKIIFLFISIQLLLFAKENPQKQYPNIRLSSSLFLDAGFTKDNSDTELRRARVSLKGDLTKCLSYEIEYNFPRGGKWKDIYLKYKLYENLYFKIGEIKEPFGFEGYTSLKYHTFMERSLTDIFGSDRKLGGLVSWYQNSDNSHFTTLSFGGFTQSVNNYKSDKDLYSIVSRLTYSDIFDKNRLIHLGGSFAYEIHDGDKIKLSTRPESHMAGKYIKAKIKHTDNAKRFGLEAFVEYDKLSFQSEYIQEMIENQDNESFTLSGYYAQISYFFTNDHKRYKKKSATLSRVKPSSPFKVSDLSGTGAIEGAFRISSLSLGDLNIDDSSYNEYTLGLNWYIDKKTKLMANYIKSDLDIYDLKTPDILEFRLEYDF